jgi:hypothetical protein
LHPGRLSTPISNDNAAKTSCLRWYSKVDTCNEANKYFCCGTKHYSRICTRTPLPSRSEAARPMAKCRANCFLRSSSGFPPFGFAGLIDTVSGIVRRTGVLQRQQIVMVTDVRQGLHAGR